MGMKTIMKPDGIIQIPFSLETEYDYLVSGDTVVTDHLTGATTTYYKAVDAKGNLAVGGKYNKLLPTGNSTNLQLVVQGAINLLTSGGYILLKDLQLPSGLSYGINILICVNYQGTRQFFRNNLLISSVGEAGVFGQTASYIISVDGGVVSALNGSTGLIDFSGTDIGIVVNACITALPNGGVIQLRAGVFTLSTAIVPLSGIILRGEGWIAIDLPSGTFGGTIIRAASSYSGNIIDNENSVAPAVQYTIENLMIDGHLASSGTGVGIRVVDPVDVHFNNVYVYGMRGQGLFIDGINTTTVYIRDCWFKANQLDQILMGTCFQLYIERSIFEASATGYYAINLSGYVSNWSIEKSYFEAGDSAVYCQATITGKFTSNYINAFATHGLILSGNSSGTSVDGNIFNDITNRGISLGGSGNVIGINTFSGCGTNISRQSDVSTRYIASPYVSSGFALGTSPIVIAHNLIGAPQIVALGANFATPVKLSWTADGTNITIYHDAGQSITVTFKAEFIP